MRRNDRSRWTETGVHERPIRVFTMGRSTHVTSNRALEEWYPLFPDDLMASAAMDRLLHHSHAVVIEGHSYRNPPGVKRAS